MARCNSPGRVRPAARGRCGGRAEAEELHRAGEPMFPPGATLGCTVDSAARGQAFTGQRAASGGDPATMAKIGGSLIALTGRTLDETGVTIADISRVAQ